MCSLPALWSLVVGHVTPALPIIGLVGLAALARRRPALGLMCAAILVTNVYLWANYLRLEHYLLVSWLILAIGSAVALESLALAVGRRAVRLRETNVAALVGVTALAFALSLGAMNWRASDRSGDRTAEAYVDALLGVLPQDAAILSEWDVSTPLWHAQLVLGRRPDVLIVDDTNIVYDGWSSRERRIAALICDRPVFMLRIDDADLEPTRAAYRVVPVTNVMIAQGGPSAAVTRPVFRIQPLESTACPG